MSDFYEQVYAVVRCIPSGQVTSYGRVARMLYKPRGARAVGYALRALYHKRGDEDYADIPWQRVVGQHGHIRVAAPGDDAPLQVELLRDEGVTVSYLSDDGRYQVDMSQALWSGLSLIEVEELLGAPLEEGADG